MKIFKKMSLVSLLALLSNACNSPVENNEELVGNISDSSEISDTDSIHDNTLDRNLCNDNSISEDYKDKIITLARTTTHEDIYSIYDRINEIAILFEECRDPLGMFPTTYRHITNRIIKAIEYGEIEDQDWAKRIVVDFASRYLENLEQTLIGGDPSYAWDHYYYLTDNDDISRTRAVVVAMVAHLTLDLPYSLVEIETTEYNKDDYFVLGELMIEITPDFIEDLRYYYDTDAEDLLNGFFLGDWVDESFGQDTTITLSYQTIRTKSWNNRWLIENGWSWVADAEIYTAFWTIDGVLATLDTSGAI
jgi:hypothetical protein